MRKLNRQLLSESGTISDQIEVHVKGNLPERIVQFGEGNFLRGFVDWMVHQLNKQGVFNGSIVAIQPTPRGKIVPKLNAQDGLYTVVLRGVENGETVDKVEIVSSISRGINPYDDWQAVLKVAEDPGIQFVFSNTTEAGLTYMKEDYQSDRSPLSFPGKLTLFLHRRYHVTGGDPKAGLVIIPCELLENNGVRLREIVIRLAKDWDLSDDFIAWVRVNNRFCNTLVDRIVTGYPADEIDQFQERLGYEDQLLTVGEPYHLFAIDADEKVAEAIPFHKVGLNVHWADVTPFRELKVRILNGAHTMTFAASFLSGKETVLDVMQDTVFRKWVDRGIYSEILPVLHIEEAEKRAFADSVIERFSNPYNKHYLVDIGLNAVLKFKERLLPTILSWVERDGTLPKVVTFSLAALIAYYRPERMEDNLIVGKRGEVEYKIRDDLDCLTFFYETWTEYAGEPEQLASVILGNEQLWGRDLTKLAGLQERVASHLQDIVQLGMKVAVEQLVTEVTLL